MLESSKQIADEIKKIYQALIQAKSKPVAEN
jgi:hypothetical protein